MSPYNVAGLGAGPTPPSATGPEATHQGSADLWNVQEVAE